MRARTLALRMAAALAVATPVALTASAALAADPTPAPSAPAPAAVPPGRTQSPDLVLSGTQTLEGKVRFYLTAHNLPYGTMLSSSALSVTADGEKLSATVDNVD